MIVERLRYNDIPMEMFKIPWGEVRAGDLLVIDEERAVRVAAVDMYGRIWDTEGDYFVAALGRVKVIRNTQPGDVVEDPPQRIVVRHDPNRAPSHVLN